MRVIQVFRAPLGGLFRHVCDLTRELDARGFSVGVLCAEAGDDPLAATRLAELETHCKLGLRRTAMPRQIGWRDVSATLAVRAFAQEADADILHGHGAKGGAYARLAAIASPRTALYTPHGGSLHYPPRSVPGIVFMTLEKALRPLSGAVLFESAFSRDVYGRRVGTPPPASGVVHNGLSDREFEPVVTDGDPFDVLYIGELRRLKGPFVLLDALSRLGESRSMRALIVGSGSDATELKDYAASLGLADRVTFQPPMPARTAFARASLMVVPSLAESLPYIVLEAAAAGVPIVASSVGGIPEICGIDGPQLVPAGDAERLAEAIRQQLDDPGAARRRADALRDRVRLRFALDRMTDGVVATYRSALTAKPGVLPDRAVRT